MSGRAYIVLSQLLLDSPPKTEWHATAITGDPSHSLVVVLWNNPNLEAAFEQLPDVITMGDPWDAVPPEALPFLQAMQDLTVEGPGGARSMAADVVESVSSAVRRVAGPLGRLVR